MSIGRLIMSRPKAMDGNLPEMGHRLEKTNSRKRAHKVNEDAEQRRSLLGILPTVLPSSRCSRLAILQKSKVLRPLLE